MKDYRKLFRFARPYYGLLALSGLFMGIVTLLDVFRLSAIVPIIDRVFTNKPITFTQGKLPVFIEDILNRLNSLAPLKVLYLLLIVVPIALIIRAIFEFFQTYIMSDVTNYGKYIGFTITSTVPKFFTYFCRILPTSLLIIGLASWKNKA